MSDSFDICCVYYVSFDKKHWVCFLSTLEKYFWSVVTQTSVALRIGGLAHQIWLEFKHVNPASIAFCRVNRHPDEHSQTAENAYTVPTRGLHRQSCVSESRISQTEIMDQGREENDCSAHC